MQGIRFDYFHGMEAEQYSFYRIPKMLFTEEYFRSLSCEAKVLYGLMLDRMGLSIKNRWIDEEDRVYIVFTVEEIAELMNCGTQKAVKLMKELDTDKSIGLIDEMLHKTFLKENRAGWYQGMLLSGKLDKHLAEVEKAAEERMEILMEGLLKEYPAPDKGKDQLAWTAHMNMLTAMAEESVLQELVYS